MRKDSELLSASRAFVAEDPARSSRLLLTTFLLAVALLAGTLLPLPVPLRAAFSIVLGLTLVRIFIFYHDYLHGAIFRNARGVGRLLSVYGILILNPPSVWRRSHNYHHDKNSQIATASIGSFPVMTTDQYRSASWPERLRYRIVRHPFTILFAYFTIFVLGMCGKSLWTDPRRHWDSFVTLLVHGILVAGLASLDIDVLLFSYFVPLGIACALGGYLFYIQHNFPSVVLHPRTDWDYVGAALDSSSFMDTTRVMHWFTGNIGYHHVHHLNSAIPFYRLPEAMAAVQELQSPRRTSLGLREIVRCLRLKLWDPEEKVMVGWP